MKESNNRLLFDEIEMTTKQETIVEASKMPRTAVLPVVRDSTTGYLNAAPYSAGVMSLRPYHIIFGVKSWDTKLVFEKAEEFVIAVPSRDQLDHMWTMACAVPHGISEIEIAGWTELPSHNVDTPGIKECRINLECRKLHIVTLGHALRNIVIADVVGISIDDELLSMERRDVVRLLPMHEAIQRHAYTGTYALSVLSGEVHGHWDSQPTIQGRGNKGSKIFVSPDDPESFEKQAVYIRSIFPMPAYIVTFLDESGQSQGYPVSGGLIMHTKPAVQIPISKHSKAYKYIKERGEFVISVPVRSHIEYLERLYAYPTKNVQDIGLTVTPSGYIQTPGIAEFPINIECTVYLLEDIPGHDYALLLGKKVGLNIDTDTYHTQDFSTLFSQYPYAVCDWGFTRKWAFHDSRVLPVRPLPTWGSRYNGAWWGGPEQWQSGMQFWLVELLTSGYLHEDEYHKIKRWISWWRSEGYWAPEPLRTELRGRLTSLFRMMVWAHRDFDKWQAIHTFLAGYPYEGRWGC